jgi:putative DNA primase/helicase
MSRRRDEEAAWDNLEPRQREIADLGHRAWPDDPDRVEGTRLLIGGSKNLRTVDLNTGQWVDYGAGRSGNLITLAKMAGWPVPGDSPADTAFRQAADRKYRNRKWTCEEWYTYEKEEGTPFMRTVRFFDTKGHKHFAICQPAGNTPSEKAKATKWEWTAEGLEPYPLYNLPNLIGPPGSTRFLVEGEKCANVLTAQRLVATTTACGALAAGKSNLTPLKDKDVIILPDNDVPGRNYARAIIHRIKDTARSIKVLELPGLGDTEDVVDWFAAGHTRNEFLDLSRSAGMPDAEEWLRRRGHVDEDEKTPPTGMVGILDGEMHNAALKAIAALAESGLPVFQRGGEIVEVCRIPERRGDGIVEVTKIVPFGPPRLRHVLGGCAQFSVAFKREGKLRWKRVDPPRELSDQIMALRGRWSLPTLVGIANTQTLRDDGTLLTAPGYDPQSGLYLSDLPGMEPIPEDLTREDAVAALRTLRELTTGFPFADAAGACGAYEAVALSGQMTVVLRPAMSVAPAHAAKAPDIGWGKTHLGELAGLLKTGEIPGVMSMPARREEQEKRLEAAAIQGMDFVHLDNMTVPVEGDFLCQMVTAPMLNPRRLGKSDVGEVKNNSVLFINGNNLVISGDLTRRLMICKLAAPEENGLMRQFARPTPAERIRADRGRYVRAVLVITRAFLASGEPDLPAPLGFEEWNHLVRTPLVWAGVADPWQTALGAHTEDPRRALMARLFDAWAEAVGTGATAGRQAKELAALAMQGRIVPAEDGDGREWVPDHPDLRETLETVAPDRHGWGVAIDPKKLGEWLRRHLGQWAAGYQLCVNDDDKRRQRWFLVPGKEASAAERLA